MVKKSICNQNSKSITRKLRLPKYLDDALLDCMSVNGFDNMSDTIRFAIAGFILRYQGNKKNENK